MSCNGCDYFGKNVECLKSKKVAIQGVRGLTYDAADYKGLCRDTILDLAMLFAQKFPKKMHQESRLQFFANPVSVLSMFKKRIITLEIHCLRSPERNLGLGPLVYSTRDKIEKGRIDFTISTFNADPKEVRRRFYHLLGHYLIGMLMSQIRGFGKYVPYEWNCFRLGTNGGQVIPQCTEAEVFAQKIIELVGDLFYLDKGIEKGVYEIESVSKPKIKIQQDDYYCFGDAIGLSERMRHNLDGDPL